MHNVRALEGKSALIIGASRGIGAATAKAFVAHGARVILASRDIAALKVLAGETCEPGNVRVAAVDAGSAADVARAVALVVDQFGRLDIAFNNAGISPPRVEFTSLSDEAFDATIALNLRAVFVAMKLEIEAMLRTGGGSIVNTGSVGSLVGLPRMAAYTASKHGLLGLTKSVALEYAKRGIRINLVAPGTVMTDMLKAGAAATPEGRAALEAATPMGRIATPDEVAGGVVWLCSQAASYVTGTTLTIDGGYSVG
jgi:NAD(P)-dependent dehydrogenase (short-subunit alcohol dehydrogenase family)